MSGQLNYCNVARDSVLKVVIIIRSSRGDKREKGETISSSKIEEMTEDCPSSSPQAVPKAEI